MAIMDQEKEKIQATGTVAKGVSSVALDMLLPFVTEFVKEAGTEFAKTVPFIGPVFSGIKGAVSHVINKNINDVIVRREEALIYRELEQAEWACIENKKYALENSNEYREVFDIEINKTNHIEAMKMLGEINESNRKMINELWEWNLYE